MGKATRVAAGVQERRCANTQHEGGRWLPLNASNFYETDNGFSYWCIGCRRRDARDRWRKANPDRPLRNVRTVQTPPALLQLDAITAGWGRR